jgi:hypothetical protein
VEEDSASRVEEQHSNGWLSLREAAVKLQLSEKTLRKRIKEGKLESKLVATQFGPAYQVRLSDVPGVASRLETNSSTLEAQSSSLEEQSSRVEGKGTQEGENASVLELVELIREMQSSLTEVQRELMAKSEAASLWQGRAEVLMTQLAEARQSIKALEAPKEPVEEIQADVSLPWWRRWVKSALGE